MGTSFFPRLAKDSIKKNRQLYFPYILTCILMVMMFYIVAFLATNRTVSSIHGGGSLQILLSLGCYIIGIFSFFFLFYSHSFLIRRRKKEFGLYYILGMNKKNLIRILFWETLMITGVSLIAGLFFWYLFFKNGRVIAS